MFEVKFGGKPYCVAGMHFHTLYGNEKRADEIRKLVSNSPVDVKARGVVVENTAHPITTVGLVPSDAKFPRGARSLAAAFALFAQQKGTSDAILVVRGAVIAIKDGVPVIEIDASAMGGEHDSADELYQMYGAGCLVYGDRDLYQHVTVDLTVDSICADIEGALNTTAIVSLSSGLGSTQIIIGCLVIALAGGGFWQYTSAQKKKRQQENARRAAEAANAPDVIFRAAQDAMVSSIPVTTCTQDEVLGFYQEAWRMPMLIAGWEMASANMDCAKMEVSYTYSRVEGTFMSLREVFSREPLEWAFDTSLKVSTMTHLIKRSEGAPALAFDANGVLNAYDFLLKRGSIFQSMASKDELKVSLGKAENVAGAAPSSLEFAGAIQAGDLMVDGSAIKLPLAIRAIGGGVRYQSVALTPDLKKAEHTFSLKGKYYVKTDIKPGV